MRLAQAIKPNKGVTAFIGGGGKTALICALAKELAEGSRVLVCSEHSMPAKLFAHTVSGAGTAAAAVLGSASAAKSPAALGVVKGEFILPASADINALAGVADYVLFEADNSFGLPLTAHAPGRPLLPGCVQSVVEVIGLSGLCRPVSMAAHNAERYAELSGLKLNDFVCPEAAAQVINKEALQDVLFINQADSKEWYAEAVLLAELVRTRCIVGSVKKGAYSIYR